MGQSISFFVAGVPAPQGSMRSPAPGVFKSDNKRTMPWRRTVAWSAKEAMSGRKIFPVALVEATFYFYRPAGHFGKGGLRPSAPKYPVTKRAAYDTDKLCRAIFDAMTGIVYEDDSRVADLIARKRWADPEVVFSGPAASPIAGAWISVLEID